METYNIEFDEIIITFTGQNDRPSEIEDKVNLASLFFFFIYEHDIHNKKTKNIKKKKLQAT